uniref:Haloacid dehalogenase-like hydrolase domain-containing protein 3 n=1 Tax=Pseudo-nitzschia arenysensis TaxID=697910 RepID=A0A7R9ZUG8_9STRA|mmetsp:Transcript_686/g.1656  ORF Transcript_686/g.1656 Transcript_686/m.1656 type:complete len:338 (+) Transcript_686:12-1025(+)
MSKELRQSNNKSTKGVRIGSCLSETFLLNVASLLKMISSSVFLKATALSLLWCHAVNGLSSSTIDASKIRAISFDVTGTLLATKEPVVKSYHDAAIWAQLSDPPSQEELKRGFKIGFKERSIASPCFGGVEGISGRDWWQETIRKVLEHCREEPINYTEDEFQRYFRRVYQHFGSPAGYMVLEDAEKLLKTLNPDLCLGITSNTPIRHMESVLPMLDNFHDNFSWFTCSQEVGFEKPSKEIFDDAFEKAKFWLKDENLSKDAILHIGDSYTCDYCGAKAYGFQALMLDRSDHPSVTAYQDWLEAPDYKGKSLEDVENNTITNLEQVAEILQPSKQLQ